MWQTANSRKTFRRKFASSDFGGGDAAVGSHKLGVNSDFTSVRILRPEYDFPPPLSRVTNGVHTMQVFV